MHPCKHLGTVTMGTWQAMYCSKYRIPVKWHQFLLSSRCLQMHTLGGECWASLLLCHHVCRCVSCFSLSSPCAIARLCERARIFCVLWERERESLIVSTLAILTMVLHFIYLLVAAVFISRHKLILDF